MRLREEFNQIIVEETPGCLWFAGLFFAFVGGVFVYGSIGGLNDYAKQSPWMMSLTFLMGSSAVAVGVWIIYNAPITKVVISRAENRVLLTRYGLFGKKEIVFRSDEIKYFRLIEERDDEGSPIWSVGMELLNDELVKITSLPSHSEEYERKHVFQINDFMQFAIPSYQSPEQLKDESEPKIS